MQGNLKENLDPEVENSVKAPEIKLIQPEKVSAISVVDTTSNPAPLGLLGFGMTTILLNIHNAGFLPLDAMILAMGIFYGGLAQIIAGIMEWKKTIPSAQPHLHHTDCSG